MHHGERPGLRPLDIHFLEGQLVRLRDLQVQSNLNGAEGVLVRFCPERGRWQVTMRDGSHKVVRLQNLEQVRLDRSHLLQTELDRISFAPARVEWKFSFVMSLEEAQKLAQAIQDHHLVESLDMSACPLGKGEGLPQLEVIAAGLKGSSVTDLRLPSTSLGPAELRVLAAVMKDTFVNVLDLARNSIGPEGAWALAAGLTSSNVTCLHLWRNSLGDAGARTLAGCLHRLPLEALEIGANSIGDKGAQSLAAALTRCSLTKLGLQRNSIGDLGVMRLASVLKESSLSSLNLLENPFGQEGGQALLWKLSSSSLIALRLDSENLAPETSAQMRAALKANRDRSFVLQIEVQKSTSRTLELAFRTMGGNIAAMLQWSLERSVRDLPAAVLTATRSSGFELPFRDPSCVSLRLVRPDGAMLNVGPRAEHLFQQLQLFNGPLDLSEGGPPLAAPSSPPSVRVARPPPVVRPWDGSSISSDECSSDYSDLSGCSEESLSDMPV